MHLQRQAVDRRTNGTASGTQTIKWLRKQKRQLLRTHFLRETKTGLRNRHTCATNIHPARLVEYGRSQRLMPTSSTLAIAAGSSALAIAAGSSALTIAAGREKLGNNYSGPRRAWVHPGQAAAGLLRALPTACVAAVRCVRRVLHDPADALRLLGVHRPDALRRTACRGR